MTDILDLSSNQWFLAVLVCIAGIVITGIYHIAVTRDSNQQLDDIVSGRSAGVNTTQRIQEKMEKMAWFSDYEKKIDKLIDLTYDKERSIESVFAWQISWAGMAVFLTLILHLILNIFILDIVVPVACLFMAYRPVLSMQSSLKSRRAKFDENLPQFINHMCLGFDSGATISKAMILAIQTLDEDARRDFDKLLIDYQMHTDDPSIAFDNLAERMPTEQCRRFCNVTSTGLKNGTEMRKIFMTETEYMTNEYRTRLQEKVKKKQNSSDVISTVFIFIPIIALMIAPLIASNL